MNLMFMKSKLNKIITFIFLFKCIPKKKLLNYLTYSNVLYGFELKSYIKFVTQVKCGRCKSYIKLLVYGVDKANDCIKHVYTIFDEEPANQIVTDCSDEVNGLIPVDGRVLLEDDEEQERPQVSRRR